MRAQLEVFKPDVWTVKPVTFGEVDPEVLSPIPTVEAMIAGWEKEDAAYQKKMENLIGSGITQVVFGLGKEFGLTPEEAIEQIQDFLKHRPE